MAWYNPSVGYLCEYLGISTFGDSPYFARVECGLGGGEVKPPPVTSSLAVVPRGSRLNCPFRWVTWSPFESSGRSHAGRAENSQHWRQVVGCEPIPPPRNSGVSERETNSPVSKLNSRGTGGRLAHPWSDPREFSLETEVDSNFTLQSPLLRGGGMGSHPMT